MARIRHPKVLILAFIKITSPCASVVSFIGTVLGLSRCPNIEVASPEEG
jgi:hypothetical protein